MPLLRYPSDILINPTYQGLNPLERLALIQIAMQERMTHQQVNNDPIGVEAYEALVEKSLVAKNQSFYVLSTELLKKDNSNIRVAIHREKKKLDDLADKEHDEQLEGSIRIKPIKKDRFNVPYEEIMRLYNEKLAVVRGLSQCLTINEQRKRLMANVYERWTNECKPEVEDKHAAVMRRFDYYFTFLGNNKNLNFKIDNSNQGRGEWVAGFDYFLRDSKLTQFLDMIKTQKYKGEQQ